MKGVLDILGNFVVGDLFTGYALYTFAFVLWTFFRKPGKMLTSWDESANLLIRYAGLFVFLTELYTLAAFFIPEERFNPYVWSQLAIWVIASQLLWIRVFRYNKLLRTLVAFALFFSFEKFVIVITSFHRDYIPSDWSVEPDPYGGRFWIAIGLALATKAVTFVVFAYCLTYLRSRFRVK